MAKYLSLRSPSSIDKKIKKVLSLTKLTCQDDEFCGDILIGSYIQKQPYWSDIDVNQIFRTSSLEKTITNVSKQIQSMVKKIIGEKDGLIFFSDFKAGHDANGRGYHWTAKEILRGDNGIITLKEALAQKSVVKLDVIFYYNGRFSEKTTFWILQFVNKGKRIDINVEEGFRDNLLKIIAQDGLNFYDEGNFLKPVKRAWSIARAKEDTKTLEILAPIIYSDIQRLSQVKSDIETLITMLEKMKSKDIPFSLLHDEIQGFKERISSVHEFDIDVQSLNIIIDLVSGSKTKSELLQSLKYIKDFLSTIINFETDKRLHMGVFNLVSYLSSFISI